MNIKVHILNASGSLGQFEGEIADTASRSIKLVAKKIPLGSVDVVFYENPDWAIPEIGIGAHTVTSNAIFVFLDPKHPHFKRNISEQIGRTVAHELYHTARWKFAGHNLLSALIFEGLADHFDIEVFKMEPQIWDRALTSKELKVFSKMAKAHYKDTKYDHDDWFFGSKDKKIPHWAGYTIGFNLVADYLERNPGVLPSGLYKVDCAKFV